MTNQLTELECTGNVARDNHRGGATCDGECRCEYCWDYAPTDAEVIADLRTKLKMRDVQLKQHDEQCQILLAKLAEVRRERDSSTLAGFTHNPKTYQQLVRLLFGVIDVGLPSDMDGVTIDIDDGYENVGGVIVRGCDRHLVVKADCHTVNVSIRIQKNLESL